MNQGLRYETAFFAGLASLGFLWKKKNRLAAGFGALALGLRFFPVAKYSFFQKSVVITGGSRGLGLALAEEFLKKGSFVTLLARDADELKRAKSELEKIPNAQVYTVICDVTNRNQLKSAFNKILKKFNTVDVLINNAGSIVAAPFEAMTQTDFEAQMNIHFYGALKSIQAVLPVFKEKGEGRIVNISSIGGRVPVPHMSPYCASKFALTGFSEAIATELKEQNIHVTTVYPGLMRTGSPVQGVFKGDAEKEFAWFAISDSTPGLTVSAQSAARKILRAIERGQSELVISWPAKLGIFAYNNFPELFNQIMTMANHFLPHGVSKERKTGAESKEFLEQQAWAAPQRRIMEEAQKRYNEKEKSDADFNLNVGSTYPNEP